MPTCVHGHYLRPSTNCYKLSDPRYIGGQLTAIGSHYVSASTSIPSRTWYTIHRPGCRDSLGGRFDEPANGRIVCISAVADRRPDLKAMWAIFRAVVATGDTLPFPDDTDEDAFRAQWFGGAQSSYVASIDSRALSGCTRSARITQGAGSARRERDVPRQSGRPRLGHRTRPCRT